MELQAYCPACQKTVPAITMLSGNELIRALSNERQITVMHTAAFPERQYHVWSLDSENTNNLRKAIAEGLVKR